MQRNASNVNHAEAKMRKITGPASPPKWLTQALKELFEKHEWTPPILPDLPLGFI